MEYCFAEFLICLFYGRHCDIQLSQINREKRGRERERERGDVRDDIKILNA